MSRLDTTHFVTTSVSSLSEVEISPRGLQDIICICDKLRNGSALEDGLWASQTNDALSCAIALKEARWSYYRLSEAQESLQGLLASLNSDMAALKTQISFASLRFGIDSLPDDMLSRIFQLAVVLDDPWAEHVPLFAIDRRLEAICLVSRRFYAVALSTPALWAMVGPRLSYKKVTRRLSLSKAVPLALDLSAPLLKMPLRLRRMEPIWNESGRLHSVRLPNLYTSWVSGKTLRKLATITSLRCIDMGRSSFYLSDIYFKFVTELSVTSLDFPATSFPSLKKLSVLSTSSRKSEESDGRGRVNSLTGTLRTLNALEFLEVEFEARDWVSLVHLRDVVEEGEPVDLPKLHTLKLKWSDSSLGVWASIETDNQRLWCFARLSRLLNVPAISTMHIVMRMYHKAPYGSDPDGNKELGLFPESLSFMTLHNLVVDVACTPISGTASHPSETCGSLSSSRQQFIERLLARTPTVRHLDIHMPHHIRQLNLTKLCPELRTLRVDGCVEAIESSLLPFLECSDSARQTLDVISLISYDEGCRCRSGADLLEEIRLDKKVGKTFCTWAHRRLRADLKDLQALSEAAASDSTSEDSDNNTSSNPNTGTSEEEEEEEEEDDDDFDYEGIYRMSDDYFEDDDEILY